MNFLFFFFLISGEPTIRGAAKEVGLEQGKQNIKEDEIAAQGGEFEKEKGERSSICMGTLFIVW